MASRFVTNLLLLLTSVFVIVAAFALPRTTGAWLAFSLGTVAVGLSLYGFALRDRGALQRVLDGVNTLTGSWLVIAARVYGPGTVHWLGFALAVGLAVLAVLGLVLRELVLLRMHALPRTAG